MQARFTNGWLGECVERLNVEILKLIEDRVGLFATWMIGKRMKTNSGGYIRDSDGTKCTRCHDPCLEFLERCAICLVAVRKNPFTYKGAYDSEKDEYIPECKDCYGEGWRRAVISGNIIPCSCNPKKLGPRQ